MKFFKSDIYKKIKVYNNIIMLFLFIPQGTLLMNYRTNALNEKYEKTKNVVQVAYNLLNHFYNQQKNGTLTEEQAKSEALKALKELRYNDNDYFWVNDMNNKMIMHPYKPELNGKDLSDFKDAKDKPLFVEFVKKVKEEKKGFVQYMWPKPGKANPVEKVSYVEGFEPWGWVVGSGIYIDDVNENITKALYNLLLSNFILLSFIMFASRILNRKILKPLTDLIKTTNSIADGNIKNLNIDHTQADNEIGQLARSLLKICNNGQRLEQVQFGLENLETAILLTNNRGEIIFTNHACVKLLREKVGISIKCSEKPHIDMLNESEILQTFTSREYTIIHPKINGNTFNVLIAPLFNERKEYVGTILEWADITEELSMQKEIEMIVKSASEGNLDQYINENTKHGFMLNLSQNVNHLLKLISNTFKDVLQVMSAVEKNDLTQRINSEYQGQFLVLKNAINEALSSIIKTIKTASQNTQHVSNASKETIYAISQISDGAQNQMLAIKQSDNSIKEITRSIVEVNESTATASHSAKKSVGIVENGQVLMGQVISIVQKLSENSSKISKITDTISKISNKTNLLALNAAIEAARAGEHGKGFAVVADEVGKLSLSASEATDEINKLIEEAIFETNRTEEAVKDLSENMGHIKESVESGDLMLSRISCAMEEQTAALSQASETMGNLQGIASSNAAASEEITATILDLGKFIESTNKELNKFKA